MKKLFAVLLGAVVLMSVVSCGDDTAAGNQNENGGEENAVVSEDVVTEETDAVDETEDVVDETPEAVDEAEETIDEAEETEEIVVVTDPSEMEIIVEAPEAIKANDVVIMMDGIMAHIPGLDNAEEKIADALSRTLNLSKVYTDADEELVKSSVEEHISYLGDFQIDNMKITVSEIESRVQAMIAEGNTPENYSEDGFNKVMQIVKTALGM